MVALPPFTAYFHPVNPLRFLNYAIPESGAHPSAAEIEVLRDAFRSRDRPPRLEWLEEAAPAVAPALEKAGLREELRAPLMACSPARLVDATADVGSLAISLVGDTDVADCASVQRQAFGQDVGDPRRNGGGAVVARVGDEPVAAAAWTAVSDGTSEIVGVATVEAWRRRGLAGAVTAAAAREAFRSGGTLCVLSPGDEGAERVYERAGFRPVATMLHWSDPD